METKMLEKAGMGDELNYQSSESYLPSVNALKATMIYVNTGEGCYIYHTEAVFKKLHSTGLQFAEGNRLAIDFQDTSLPGGEVTKKILVLRFFCSLESDFRSSLVC